MLGDTNSYWGGNECEGSVLTMTKEGLIRQYLLGDLPQEERDRLEDQYFTNSEAFEELVEIENDLIDSFVRQELSPSEVKQFEKQYFTSPLRRARVEFARSLNRACLESTAKADERPFISRFSLRLFSHGNLALQWGSIAAALLLATSGSWLILQNYHLRKQLREAREQSSSVQAQLEPKQKPPQGSVPDMQEAGRSQEFSNANIARLETPREAVFTLRAGTIRSAENKQIDLAIPTNVSTVILRLTVGNALYAKYQAELQTAEGRKLQSANGLISRKLGGQAMILFRVPASRLGPGDYIVILSGTDAGGRAEEVEAYSFRTVAR